MEKRDKKWLALVSSFVLPGLGQLYNRELPKAIAIWVVLVAAILLTRPEFSLAVPQYAVIAAGAVALAAYVFNVYDAYYNGGRR